MGEQIRVVAHFTDGKVVKGTTDDFLPSRPTFHLHPVGSNAVQEVQSRLLKAVFFVKDFAGNPARNEARGFGTSPTETNQGKKIAVRFKDAEVLCGYTLAFTPERTGFFMLPADSGSNNIRIFVLKHATQEIAVGPKAEALAKAAGDKAA